MSSPWKFGTVVRLSDEVLRRASRMADSANARVMVIQDLGVPSFSGLSLVETEFHFYGDVKDNWTRASWVPTDA